MVERVLLGKHPDTGTVGLWVSRPTKNARTSTDVADFLVHPDKINQRPFLRYEPIKFSRGAFKFTRTYNSDTQRADTHTWEASYYHSFGYVPVAVAVPGANTTGEPWLDAARVVIPLGDFEPYRYVTGDASKTPIAGTSLNTANLFYDISDDTINWLGAGTRTGFIIYRNSIT